MTNTDANTLITVGTFSLFADFYAKTPALRDASLKDIYEAITDGHLAVKTTALRAESATVIQDKLKKELPFLTVSSRFDEAATSKAANQPITHSGYLCFDFDHLAPTDLQRLRTAFKGDRQTVLQFVSPRGEGLKRIVKVAGVTVDNHEQVYYCLLLLHYHIFKAVGDETCVNLNRGTFLPYDAHAYYNPKAAAYEVKHLIKNYPDAERKAKALAKAHKTGDFSAIPENLLGWELPELAPTKKAAQKPAVSTVKVNGTNAREVAERLIAGLKASGGSITNSYDDWVRVGTSLKNELGEDGYQYFDELSQQDASKYDAQQCRSVWNGFPVRSEGEVKANAGTLVLLGRENGIDAAPKATKLTVTNSHSNKLTQMDIRDILKQIVAIYYDAGSDTYYHGVLGDENPFNFKEFHAKSTFLNELLNELEQENIHISKSKLEETLFNRLTYTEIKYLHLQLDWIGKHWDGQDHLNTLYQSIDIEDKELFEFQFRKWAVNIVAQAYGDGEKSVHENVLVLVGEQGGGKTGFFKSLLWNRALFAAPTTFSFENKEHMLLMNSKVLILLDEMAAYNKADVRQMKAALSQPFITADRKFQHTADYVRNATFAGCSNNSDFLKDDTGDRRFLVFTMRGQVDWDIYNAVDKQQLWGQLVTMFKNGFDYKFSASEVQATIQRNLGGFTAHKPEDTFLAECIEVTSNSSDFLSNADMEKLMNDYKQEHHVRDWLNISSVRAKLKLAGAQVGQQKKIAGKVLKGFSGVRRAGYVPTTSVSEKEDSPFY